MSKWQPIETAPKDGTPVLLCDAGYGQMDVGVWEVDRWCMYDSGGAELYTSYFYTHWMKLPRAPSSKITKRREEEIERFYYNGKTIDESIEEMGGPL